MANAVKDSFLDLERHRQLLEENVEKLRKSLQHWQIWEAEYEGLKEEILAAGPAPSHEQLVAVGREFEGKLVAQTEVEDILGVIIPRNVDQVTNILSRRIDYVSQNVKTLYKQLVTAENKLAAATVVSNPDVRDEEGLPLTEIIEELDEEGNLVSARTETQGSARGQLLEVLEKAGVKDFPRSELKEMPEFASTRSIPSTGASTDEAPVVLASPEPSERSVQFADGTKEGPEAQKSQTAKRLEAITNGFKAQKLESQEPPIIPTSESPEDAALRREMLQYGMSEVGAVVAELDLEDDSDYTDDECYDNDDASSMEDEEDEHGRSTRKVVTEEIRQRMIELEEKLGLRMMENAGPNPHIDTGDESVPETRDASKMNEAPDTAREKKGVRFAEELDISRNILEPIPSEPPKVRTTVSSKSPIGDIVERTPQKTELKKVQTVPQQKMSRFKSARVAQPSARLSDAVTNSSATQIPSTLATPTHKLLADVIIEREVAPNSPPEPDELDPALLQKEVAIEYNQRRNQMIQKQGGFMKDPELEKTGIIPLTEEEGGPKRMSRFKAARLTRP